MSRILVVDDDKTTRLVLRRVLTSAGFYRHSITTQCVSGMWRLVAVYASSKVIQLAL